MKKLILSSLLTSMILAGCATTDMQLPAMDQNPTQAVEAEANRYKLDEIVGIGAKYQELLNKESIKYVDQYLPAAAKRTARAKLAEKTGISTKLLLTWVNHADLMTVKGIGPRTSRWLEACGVDSVKELAQRKVENLYPKLELANNIDPKKQFVKRMPSMKEVEGWVIQAKAHNSIVEE